MHRCIDAYIHTYIHTYVHTYIHTYMLMYVYVYSRPTYLYTNFPNVQQRLAQVAQDDSAQTQQSEKQYSCATSTLLQQHCNTWQLLWIFHGSGALPYQGHLRTTTVNNRQRTWSQNNWGILNKQQWTTGRGLDPRALGDSQQHSANIHKPQWQRQR